MSTSTPDKKIIDRIHKLLRLSAEGSGATEAEAALAAERVQSIMREHNLSMAMLEAHGGDASAEGGVRTTGRTERRAMYRWQRELMAEVAHVNFCHCDVIFGEPIHRARSSTKRGSPRGYRLIGREANVASARELFDYLIEAISRILMEQELGGEASQANSRRANSFREGCADRLRVRLRERHDAALAEQARAAREAAARSTHPAAAPSGNALVVVLQDYAQSEDDLNNDLRYGYPPGTTAQRRARYKAEQEEHDRRVEARIAELMKADPTLDRRVAERLARGWSDTREEAEIALGIRPDPSETVAQRARREEREKRAQERFWARYAKEQARRDQAAYSRGSAAGGTIGLSRQIDGKGTGRLS